jgi:hypothetical protein
VYRARLDERRNELAGHERRHIRIGNIRLLLGLAAAVIAWQSFVSDGVSALWLAAPVTLFAALVLWHERILRSHALARRAVDFYERGLARIEDRWAGTGETGERFLDTSHPYSGDLDLFGKGSLFELLSQARTAGGEETLAGWLLAPAAPEEILKRQEAIRELRGYVDLRERMFVLGEDVRRRVHTEELVRWAESPAMLPGRIWFAAVLLTAGNGIAALAWYWSGLASFLFLTLATTAAFGFWLRRRVLNVLHRVDHPAGELAWVTAALSLLEESNFRAPLLVRLHSTLLEEGRSPSRQIAKLNRIVEWILSRDNPLVRVLGPPLLCGTHLAFAAERWRAHSGPHVRRWFDVLSEMEALLSLSGYAFEHPADPFAEFETQTMLEGERMGHPLLAQADCVANSVSLGATPGLLVVSGSNMSGKSTYLRTIGVNTVLAMAGAPVRARRFRLSPLSVGATIRITDSLQGGTSRFYAEIKRLRRIVDLTESGAVLFLLDELLNGTNSRDRRVGGEAVLRELLDRGGIGLITTHDLALTAIGEALAPRAANVHFEDHLENGKLRFDYTVRPGVVEKSNALELMRSIGLDVGDSGS